jgi:enoyl-CoA hydratase/carnithine racemase
MPSNPSILSEIKNQVLHITLNYPEKHNCFGMAELEAIHKLLLRHQTDADVKAVVFRGAGERSFSTGANLKQFTALDQPGTMEWIKKGHDLFNFIENFSKPTVAVIQGFALGGGMELALSCDFRVASEKAVFGSPELRHGWLPGWGGIHRLKKLLGEAAAKEIIFLADHLPAQDAYRLGLIHRLTPPEALEEETITLLDKLKLVHPDAFSMAKAAISESGDSGPTTSQIWFDVLSTLHSKRNVE